MDDIGGTDSQNNTFFPKRVCIGPPSLCKDRSRYTGDQSENVSLELRNKEGLSSPPQWGRLLVYIQVALVN